MNFKNFFLFVLLSASVIFTTSCEDPEETNEITINILEPSPNEVIADASNVQIKVDVEATIENHEFELVLYPSDDANDKIIDYDKHDHDMVLNFDQAVDLSSYPSGQAFKLEVKACLDHDCEMSEMTEIEFTIQ